MNDVGDDTLIARDLHFAYQKGQDVLRGADLTARSGALLCMLGPNGSGKTTLLRCLLGRLKPRKGRILLADCPLGSYLPRQRARQLAYVPQFPSSAFDFTAGQIVQMGRLSHTGPLGLIGANDREVVRLAMQMTDTVEFMDRSLMELSGGEAQRVMIARALAQQPSVLLLDEPTSHLDVRHQMTIYRMMTRLAHDWRMAVVCVSHDVNLAARFADELIVMKDGQVLADGPARDVICPEVLSEAYDVQVALVDSGDEMPMVRVI